MAWPNRTRHEQELYRLLNSENEQIRLDAAKELEKIAARKSKARKAKAQAKKTVDPIWEEVHRLEAAKYDDGDEPFIIDDYPAPVTPVGSSPNAASIADTCPKIETPSVEPELPQVPKQLTEQARENLAAHKAWEAAGSPTTRVLTEWEPPPPVYNPFLPSGIENRFPFNGPTVAQKFPTWDPTEGWTSPSGETERQHLAKQIIEAERRKREGSW
jgi:hypothetical protein